MYERMRFHSLFQPRQDLLLPEEAVEDRQEEGQHDDGAHETEQAALLHHIPDQIRDFHGQPDGPVLQPVDRAEIKPQWLSLEKGARLFANFRRRFPQPFFHFVGREGDAFLLFA